MGCGTTCMKCILCIINIIFALIGIVLLGCGIFVKVSANDKINDVMADVIEGIPGLPDLLGLVSSKASEVEDGLKVDFHELLSPIAVPLIVIGVIIAAIAVCGLIGACCNSKMLMGLYCVLVAVILAAQIVIVIMFFVQFFDDDIRDLAVNLIKDEYKGIDDYGAYSLALNSIMTYFECCGVDNYKDFDKASQWEKHRTFNISDVGPVNKTLVTPIACCKFEGDWPEVDVTDDSCAINPHDNSSNWNTGCWGEVVAKLQESETLAIGIIAAILVIQAIVLVFAICLACNRDDNDKVV